MNIMYIISGSEVGTFFRAFFWAKYLVKKGHRVSIICSSPQPTLRLIKFKYVDNVRIINLFKTKYKWDYPGYIFRTFLVFLICLMEDYDLLHSFVVCQPPSIAGLISGRLKKLFSKRTTLFADWDDWWGGGDGICREHSWIVQRGIAFLEKKMPHLADYLTVVSSFLEEEALKIGIHSEKIYKIPNGADVERIYPINQIEARERLNIREGETILCYIGHFHTSCIKMMISAFAKVLETDPDVYLIVIGGIYEGLINRFNANVKRHIKLLGKKPIEEIPFYLGASDILLLPMENSNIEKVRWPIRFGEYLAAGKPIVSNAVGEIKNIIETYGCGIISDYEDPEDFSRQIIKLLLQKDVCTALGRHARRIAETVFSWDIIVRKLEDIYVDVYNKYFDGKNKKF